MGRLPNKQKQNPKLIQREMSDGRASLWLEYYLGRSESPVYDDDGNHVVYESGAMKGKLKYKVQLGSGTAAEQEHHRPRREDTVRERTGDA